MEQVFIVTRTTENKFGLVPYPEENNVILKVFKHILDAQDFITNMSYWNKFAMEDPSEYPFAKRWPSCGLSRFD